jgi:very-short-patch-repair endonuclease
MILEPRQFARGLRKVPTPAEDKLWQALRGRRFQDLKFKRQVPIGSYTVDFLCFERKLIIELDGRQHDWFAEYDAKRTEDIEHHGFTVLRFKNSDVIDDIDDVMVRIARALEIPTANPHPRPLSHPGEG